jgi:hypothetical protein
MGQARQPAIWFPPARAIKHPITNSEGAFAMSDHSKILNRWQTLFGLMLGMMVMSPAYSGPVVPWLNQPAAEKAAAVQAHAQGAFPCGARDLNIAAGAAGAWRGQATQEIRITNTGAEACHLIGFPSAQLEPAGEAPQAVGASDTAPQLANERIDLAPGDQAELLLGTPGSCAAAAKPQRNVSRRVQLALPGGGVKVLDGVYLDTLCGRATVLQFRLVESDSPTAPMNQLAGSLTVPDNATRGATLHYIVTLSNPTANPVSLASCPAYTQSLFANGKSAASTLLLNCAAAGASIPANSSVSFEMQAPVPSDVTADSVKLSWKLQDGPAVGKIIHLR